MHAQRRRGGGGSQNVALYSRDSYRGGGSALEEMMPHAPEKGKERRKSLPRARYLRFVIYEYSAIRIDKPAALAHIASPLHMHAWTTELELGVCVTK